MHKSRRNNDGTGATAVIEPPRMATSGSEGGSEPDRDLVERRAYERYCERGCEDGHDLEDWLAAERELFTRPGPGERAPGSGTPS
jgi:hypothetical protein